MLRRKSVGDTLELPITPMIDCMFQLFLFFLLTASLVGMELPKLALHTPKEPVAPGVAADREQLSHVTVNILTRYGDSVKDRDARDAGQAAHYQVGVDAIDAKRPDAMDALTTLLKSRKTQAESRGAADFWVEIRADKDVRYGDIEPVMQAAAEAGIVRMSLTAGANDGAPKPAEEGVASAR